MKEKALQCLSPSEVNLLKRTLLKFGEVPIQTIWLEQGELEDYLARRFTPLVDFIMSNNQVSSRNGYFLADPKDMYPQCESKDDRWLFWLGAFANAKKILPQEYPVEFPICQYLIHPIGKNASQDGRGNIYFDIEVGWTDPKTVRPKTRENIFGIGCKLGQGHALAPPNTVVLTCSPFKKNPRSKNILSCRARLPLGDKPSAVIVFKSSSRIWDMHAQVEMSTQSGINGNIARDSFEVQHPCFKVPLQEEGVFAAFTKVAHSDEDWEQYYEYKEQIRSRKSDR